MPRWVRVLLIATAALLALLVILKVSGAGGEHGPRRHGAGALAPPGVVVVVLAPGALPGR
jgi:hypothetical protein